jgi:peroxiredoxin
MHPDHHLYLEEQLAELRAQRASGPPELLSAMLADIAQLAEIGLVEQSLGVGDQAPDFTLLDTLGNYVTLSTLLRRGPVVVTFYRGAWCPYCNLQLRAYQGLFPEITRLGATLLALSPQIDAASQHTATTKELTFPVLSDIGNAVAQQYGLVYNATATLRQIYLQLGTDLREFNGDDSWGLPLPGTFVVDQQQQIRLAFVDPDYTQRLEPARLLTSLQEIMGLNA